MSETFITKGFSYSGDINTAQMASDVNMFSKLFNLKRYVCNIQTGLNLFWHWKVQEVYIFYETLWETKL